MLAILVAAIFQYVISGCCTGSEDMLICNVNPCYQFYQLYQITTSSNNKICFVQIKIYHRTSTLFHNVYLLFKVCLYVSLLFNPQIRVNCFTYPRMVTIYESILGVST